VESAPPIKYRKLTRMHRGFGLMSQLWLGGDHLLHVTSTGYTESYRRCYLRDIQTMLIVHTGRRTYLALTLLVLLLIVGSIMNAAGSGAVGYSVLGVIFGALFLWNHLRGAGCRVVVITAVQQEKVPSLSRLPKTRRIIGELKPLIEAAQTEFGATGEPLPAAETVPAPTGSLLPPPLPPPLPLS
jgi:hypothetical protein